MRQMAAILHISEPMLEMLVKKDAAARHALEEGRAITSHTIRKSAYQMAQHDPVMMKFWLKTREGFREVDRVEITGKDGEEIKVMTVDERKKQFAKVLKALEITKRERKKNGQDTE